MDYSEEVECGDCEGTGDVGQELETGEVVYKRCDLCGGIGRYFQILWSLEDEMLKRYR